MAFAPVARRGQPSIWTQPLRWLWAKKAWIAAAVGVVLLATTFYVLWALKDLPDPSQNVLAAGDVNARVWIRIREVEQSLGLIEQVLAVLPQGPLKVEGLENIQLVHGSPLDEDEYIIVQRDAYEPLAKATVPITFFGHTHIQGGFSSEDDEWVTLRPIYDSDNELETFVFQMSKTAKYLINPGSIGPRRFYLPILFGVMEITPERVSMKHVDCETGKDWLP